jgi:ribosomal protein S18 acetylase RimI-like enzyme
MTLAALERACLEAWPAKTRMTRHGWEHCASSGKSGRVNCVWAIDWTDDVPASRAIAEAEGWCETQGIAPVFKLTDGLTAPFDLPIALTSAGYEPRSETLIMTAPVSLGPPPRAAVEIYDIANHHVWSPISRSATPEDYRERSEIVRRIAAPHVFALNRSEGAPACAGMAVLSGELVGIYLMRTAPYARRQGFARQVLRALLHWGATHEASTAYLQVEEANAPAVDLYASEGFTIASRYRYWSKSALGAS